MSPWFRACLVIAGISLIVLVGVFASTEVQMPTVFQTLDTVPVQGIQLNVTEVERASSPAEHRAGLMFRQELCDTCIILFVFEQEAPRNFWMKNTVVPLDMIFVDAEGKIVTIHANTVPLQSRPTYSSTQPAQYVIEGTAGFVQRFNLQQGDLLDIQFLQDQAIDLRQAEVVAGG